MDHLLNVISLEMIEKKIYFIRGQKGMLDHDLDELYGVETPAQNQAVRRNADRSPADFMFELDREEIMRISQIVISSPLSVPASASDSLSYGTI